MQAGVDCDIALLDVEDEAFWEGVEPLRFGPLPRLQEPVAVVGYPVGGDTISVTAGVVSRIEVRWLAYMDKVFVSRVATPLSGDHSLSQSCAPTRVWVHPCIAGCAFARCIDMFVLTCCVPTACVLFLSQPSS